MSFFGKVGSFFKAFGQHVKDAFTAARYNDLTNDVVKTALIWVKVAANKAIDNGQKREFVVDILVSRGIPESVARLAVELAFQLFKAELAKV